MHVRSQVDEDEVAAGRASSEPLTMYVKNLSFSTNEAGLRRCFEKAGLSVRSVSIPLKKGPGASEATLSMGFGFVECADKSLVDKALKVGFPCCGWRSRSYCGYPRSCKLRERGRGRGVQRFICKNLVDTCVCLVKTA